MVAATALLREGMVCTSQKALADKPTPPWGNGREEGAHVVRNRKSFSERYQQSLLAFQGVGE